MLLNYYLLKTNACFDKMTFVQDTNELVRIYSSGGEGNG